MAIFSNQATLTYNGTTTSSNVAYGELLEVLTATKTAVENGYAPGSTVTYVVTLRNTGSTPLTGLTVTDDLGGYSFGAGTVYPLEYVADSVRLFADGVPQPAPAAIPGPPLVFTGVSVPAEGDTVLVYQTTATAFASPAADGTVTNTVTVTGDGVTGPVTASATVDSVAAPELSITKSITPAQVVDNDRVTYTFVIQNRGTTPVEATDNGVITDVFNPVLTDLAVTFEGMTWTQGVQYTYNEATGLFTTEAGQITVPAATYTQNPVTGEFTVTPGVATLAVTGTI